MTLLRPIICQWKDESNATESNRDREISPRVTINALPDEMLLKIFDFCRVAAADRDLDDARAILGRWSKIWHKLVHVCQRWRNVVFSSPLRLNLRLYCSDRISVREVLDVWPPLLIEISARNLTDDIIATLEHYDRISKLSLWLSSSECERLATVMRQPFPALTNFRLGFQEGSRQIPMLLLGESAPCLRSLFLSGVAFPTLPQLLLSCNHLSRLELQEIPNLGYISPEAMATGLSALPKLTSLEIEFKTESTTTLRSLPLTRAILPALTEFRFRGVSEYLEDLLARIDVPQLEYLSVWFFQQEVFNTRQVISHSRALGPFHCATVTFGQFSTHINLRQSEGKCPQNVLELGFIERAPGQQVSVSSIAQICTQLSPLLSSVTKLHIESIEASEGDDVGDLMDNPDLLLLLFHQFAAVRTLHLSGQILPILVSFLGRLTGESVIGVLPELQNLYLRDNVLRCFEGPQALEKFIAACRDSDHPVTYGVGSY
ncbi:hypothetical protein BGW80DRAFT_1257641 [Lactifluus volemus]|nr:hypothetical protein BGW80DRAFT_1257641 [Lactifluus volemus]